MVFEYRYGIQIVTEDNFLEPSEAAMMFSSFGLSTLGPAPAIDEELKSRVLRFTAVTLHDNVPQELWRMFEVAKGAMIYGLFFYPLYTLGTDHLFRAFEYLVKLQYETLRGEKLKADLKSKVKWLINNGHFPDSSERWIAMYNIRNLVSHPEMQSITTPAEASRTLHLMKLLIEHFYPPMDI